MAKETWKHISMTAPDTLWSNLKNNGFKIMTILTHVE